MYGMMGMRMGGMGMMGMGGMGMMGMSGMGGMGMGMGMMGGGGTQQPAPKIEHPPGLQREDHIQLGTNFVSRLEVRSQPVVQVCSTGTFHPPSSSRHTPGRSPPGPFGSCSGLLTSVPPQIKAYLTRQMGLTESEVNEVLRRTGIDPAAGRAQRSEQQPGRGPGGAAGQQQQQQQLPASFAYGAMAAALAPPQRTWRQWLLGPTSAEAQQAAAAQAMQQQLLEQAYRTPGSAAPPVLVFEEAAAAAGIGRVYPGQRTAAGPSVVAAQRRGWGWGRRWKLFVAMLCVYLVRVHWCDRAPIIIEGHRPASLTVAPPAELRG
jgi:hypothetical protein